MIEEPVELAKDLTRLVLQQADSVVAMYLAGAKYEQPVTREQKESIESIIAADYDGRTVVELLQNGHDAHDSGRSDGKLEFLLDENEGAHGVLYAANGGRPLDQENFRSMCLIARSSKRPDEGIGNKGVGFKSVLQLSDCPEVYSARHEGAGRFDGFRFRFGRPDDFDGLAARSKENWPGLADELRENVSTLKITVPLFETPTVVEDFARRGYSTVVRLPLRSASTRDHARDQLEELAHDEVPFHLFLTRVAEIVVRSQAGETESRRRLTRSTRARRGTSTLSVEHIDLGEQREYVILKRVVAETGIRAAIRASLDDNAIGSGWAGWQGAAEVSVAVPLGAALSQGRVYTFLPLGPGSPCPIAALVNGPFFTRLDRRDVHESIPLNDFLFAEIAALCADAVVAACRGDLELPDEVPLDLVCWAPGWTQRLIAALQALGVELVDLPVLPPLQHQGEGLTFKSALLWSYRGAVFTPEAVTAAGETRLIRYSIDEQRLRRLRKLAKATDHPVEARPADLAGFAETLADDLLRRGESYEVWAGFYDDLSVVLTDVTLIRGHRVFLTEGGILRTSIEDDDLMIYFGPVRGEAGELPELPEVVRDRLAFMPADINWSDERGQRPGRRWLEAIVREYRTDAVLDLIGKVMYDTEAEEVRSACLRFAFDLWQDTPAERRATALGRAGLLVRTRSGWKAPAEAYFDAGWGGPAGKIDRQLADLVKATALISGTLAAVGQSLLFKPELGEATLDDVRTFFEALGVRHGLVPLTVRASRFQLQGKTLKNPRTVPVFPIEISVATQAAWRELAARHSGKPSYDSTRYQPAGGIAYLPGQEEWSEFDDTARRLYFQLVLHGLEVWPATTLWTYFQASSDSVRVTWPTFVAAFLVRADWIPQTTPGDRGKQFFRPMSDAWWVGNTDTPDYLSADPAAFRSLLTDRVRVHLQRLGARFWDDPGTAADRLRELTSVVRLRGPRMSLVRNAYEQAWRDLADRGEEVPHEVIVSVHGSLGVLDLDQEGPAVYTLDEDGAVQAALLIQTPLPMLAVRSPGVAERVRQTLVSDGVSRLRAASAATVQVLADGTDPLTMKSQPLTDLGGDWLPLLVDAIADRRRQALPAAGITVGATAGALRDSVGLVLADSITAVIDGHPVDQEFAPSSMRVVSPEGDPVIVALRGTGEPWVVLQSAAAALAEFRGGPPIADSVRLALIDLTQRCGDRTPTLDDLAVVLKLPVTELQSLAGDAASTRFEVTPVLGLLACLDPGIAEELQGDRIGDQQEMLDWLSRRGFDADEILALAGQNDLLDATRQLDIPLAQANAGLRAVNLPLLHNDIGHRQQFDAYLQRHRPELQDQLRDRFVARFRRGEPLDEYLRLRDLPGLEPDSTWLDTYWHLPDHVVQARLDLWLASVGEPLAGKDRLPPVDELRDRGRRAVMRTLERARIVIEAWLQRNTAGTGARPAEIAGTLEKMVQTGFLDFEVPRTSAVVVWLGEHGQWPVGMPATTEPRQLDLTDGDLKAAESRLNAGHDTAKRRTETVRYAGKTYSTGTEDRDSLIRAVRESVPQGVLDTSATADRMAPLPPSSSAVSGSSSGEWRAPVLSAEKTRLIGLAGEIVAGEWLNAKFGLQPEDTWVSGYRAEYLADGKGNDSCGYDFLVTLPDRTLLYEVKATTDNARQFTLGESEVRRANALRPHEEYHILFISNVLDPDKMRLRVLPNPFSVGGLASYQVVGRSLNLRFRSAD
ncbi:hypothetical protein AMES_5725 [Amycolatopsis mediterranei S699]|uniref:Protein NO VEIN C-terminal domain-containing protein n=2 Tax=Amycolatopsis mediterranei TaxID=33910 RepID=A0A0H3D964_AMYMU|nr:DUF3883 domain-containing protein [Amycolatopsis mediterranei]ADJ47550.1 conserved hypothetical protein [Amycolatopsis mediterranei U32]AEK44421.1 hypothetical protein RAM_29730 [Amycolatopsis mediterranei S699]AFO79261.1 hypothetical protein AMES_5725 [Amycolatopsis mediterranei S699]AGT86389.1 hypothetical protein B737_5725 [Amycolatopsis mediterranei RB]KDO08374.1 hypothetical protein DV26_23545 [Amycolatopsis mediterranei]